MLLFVYQTKEVTNMDKKKESIVEENIEQEQSSVEENKIETVNESIEENASNENENNTPEEEEVIKLEDDFDYEDTPLNNIEIQREAMLKYYKKQSAFKMVAVSVGIVIIALAFLLIPNLLVDNQNLRLALMIVLSVIALGGMFTFNIVSKKLLNKKMKAYFKTYYDGVVEYCVSNVEGVSEVHCEVDNKISEDQFTNNNLWKNVVQVGSRASTNFKYNGLDIFLVDAAGQIREDKRLKPIFVGKYLIAPNNYDNENPIIIYLKGDKRSIPPTNLDDIKCVHDDSRMAIYSNNNHWSKYINKNVRDVLLQLETRNDLIDVSISIQNKTTYICLGYDDSLMVLPLDKKLNSRPIKQFKKDIVPTLEFIQLLNK